VASQKYQILVEASHLQLRTCNSTSWDHEKNGKSEPIDLHVLIEKEGRLYSALCLELDVASQGHSIAEAKKMSSRQ